jgi:hypothetical protein
MNKVISVSMAINPSTRDKLVGAALDYLNKKGDEGMTVTGLTKAANVGYGTFYHYFKSTDEIFEAAMKFSIDEAVVDLLSHLEKQEDKAYTIAFEQLKLFRTLAHHPATPWMMTRTTKFADLVIDGFSDHAYSILQDAVSTGKYKQILLDDFDIGFKIKMWTLISGVHLSLTQGHSIDLERCVLMLSLPQIGTEKEHHAYIERVLSE